MILEILIVVTMFLWFLTILPVQQMEPWRSSSSWLVFIWALMVTLYLFMLQFR